MSPTRLADVQACVFDAYGTLFDVNSAAERARGRLGRAWQPLADAWRAKQLQYTWLRSLAGRHADFWQVTGDALDVALAGAGMADPALRAELMALYLSLGAYPDVKPALSALGSRGMRLAILSNGSPRMLASAVEHAGLADLLEAVLSVEEVGVYKPHPSVYRMGVDRLGLPADRMCFVSSNGWDAFSAKAFGYRVVWCNRFGQAPERIPERPDLELPTLAGLPDVVSMPGEAAGRLPR